jgi:hypothetical protein
MGFGANDHCESFTLFSPILAVRSKRALQPVWQIRSQYNALAFVLPIMMRLGEATQTHHGLVLRLTLHHLLESGFRLIDRERHICRPTPAGRHC